MGELSEDELFISPLMSLVVFAVVLILVGILVVMVRLSNSYTVGTQHQLLLHLHTICTVSTICTPSTAIDLAFIAFCHLHTSHSL